MLPRLRADVVGVVSDDDCNRDGRRARRVGATGKPSTAAPCGGCFFGVVAAAEAPPAAAAAAAGSVGSSTVPSPCCNVRSSFSMMYELNHSHHPSRSATVRKAR